MTPGNKNVYKIAQMGCLVFPILLKFSNTILSGQNGSMAAQVTSTARSTCRKLKVCDTRWAKSTERPVERSLSWRSEVGSTDSRWRFAGPNGWFMLIWSTMILMVSWILTLFCCDVATRNKDWPCNGKHPELSDRNPLKQQEEKSTHKVKSCTKGSNEP